MPALPLRDEYGPTLGQLLTPPWRDASRLPRALVLVAGGLLVALLAAGALTLAPPLLSHGGQQPFSFSYAGLYRTAPNPGGYAKVQRLEHGRLEDSFAVGPLVLPPYQGELGSELALYAAGYIRGLPSRYPGFELRGEGRTQIDSVASYAVYNIFYTTQVQGREMYGRNVLLLAEHPGARRGVEISMLTTTSADRQVTSPLQVGTKGTLEGPLGSFTLG
jgi:hypothetical protein